MEECEVCGKELKLPFKCSFCLGTFCALHRLPEKHNCSESPPREPLGEWKAKEQFPSLRYKKSFGRLSRFNPFMTYGDRCPECWSDKVKVSKVGKKTVTFKCGFCGWVWESAPMRERIKRRRVVLLSCFLIVLGIVIILLLKLSFGS